MNDPEADALDRLWQEVHEAHARLDDSTPTEMGGKVLTLVERIAELEQTADDALARYDATAAELVRVTAERNEAQIAEGRWRLKAEQLEVSLTAARGEREAAERRAAQGREGSPDLQAAPQGGSTWGPPIRPSPGTDGEWP